jgi:hypothetical protein
MVSIGTGLAAQLGIGVETAYGEEVAPSAWIEFESHSLKPSVKYLEYVGLGDISARTGRSLPYIDGGGGEIAQRMMNKGLALDLMTIFGKVSGSAGAQTFVLDTVAGKQGRSYTVQAGVPRTDGVVEPFTFRGGKVLSATMVSEVGQFKSLSRTWDFKDAITSLALGTPMLPALATPLPFMSASLSVGGSPQRVRRVEIVVATPLSTDDIALGIDKHEPLASDEWMVTGNLDVQFESRSLYDAYVAGTLSSLVLTDGYGAASLVTTIPALQFRGDTPSVSGRGIVRVTVPFKALFNGTNPLISALWTSSDGAVV